VNGRQSTQNDGFNIPEKLPEFYHDLLKAFANKGFRLTGSLPYKPVIFLAFLK
jgi:hypothetical protein